MKTNLPEPEIIIRNVRTLFEYLEGNYTLDEFLECFPSVTREMAHNVLARSEEAFLAPV